MTDNFQQAHCRCLTCNFGELANKKIDRDKSSRGKNKTLLTFIHVVSNPAMTYFLPSISSQTKLFVQRQLYFYRPQQLLLFNISSDSQSAVYTTIFQSFQSWMYFYTELSSATRPQADYLN